jgi:hypothetical protein
MYYASFRQVDAAVKQHGADPLMSVAAIVDSRPPP